MGGGAPWSPQGACLCLSKSNWLSSHATVISQRKVKSFKSTKWNAVLKWKSVIPVWSCLAVIGKLEAQVARWFSPKSHSKEGASVGGMVAIQGDKISHVMRSVWCVGAREADTEIPS